MDKASDLPDPRDDEASVAAVYYTVEENVTKDWLVFLSSSAASALDQDPLRL